MPEPTHEPFDAADLRLAGRVRAYADRAVTPVDVTALARDAVALGRTRRRVPLFTPTARRPVAGWTVALLALVGLALLGGAIVAGALRPGPRLLALDPATTSASPADTPSAPAASSAPSRIVFLRAGSLYLASADGTDAREIVPHVRLGSGGFDPRWAPTGRRFAVVLQGGLAVYADDGGLLATFPTTSSGWPQFAWSPDGSRLAVLREGGPLEIVSVDGSPARTLDLPADFRFADDLPSVAWSPDGAAIAFSGCSGCSEGKASADRLWVEGVDGTGLRALVAAPIAYDPVWTDDGRMLFGRASADRTSGWLATIRADGSGDRPIYQADAWLGDIEVSPDGSRVVVRRNPDGILTVDLDGSDPIVAADIVSGLHVDWSPDGQHLLTRTNDGVVEFAPDGSHQRVIVPGADAFDLGVSH